MEFSLTHLILMSQKFRTKNVREPHSPLTIDASRFTKAADNL
jgi:hypothetical protein